MKSFKKLVLPYLKDITGPLLDPLQFAYRANRSVDDAINMGLHFILQHLDKTGTYVRILFVDFSSAFNTIIPTALQTKLTQLSVPSSICQWISSFLSDRQQLKAKKAQQRLYFLRQLKKFNLPQELLKQFYSALIESVLCTSITVWFGSATKSDIRRLQRTVRTAERIIGAPLPTLQELYTSRVRKRAQKITLDPSHPSYPLFELLPSGRHFRAANTSTVRHKNSFFPQAIYLMNS
uniref:Alkylated DNA repair protein AlkB homologue 8 N-terminal domain-containing protein n=1 Tax=Cyprinus carpio carpio TaxID=630221 RepID=A0A9J8BE90_CYPCA